MALWPYGFLLPLWLPAAPMVSYCPYGFLLSLQLPA